MQLAWDLHVHPGPSAAPRWGTGLQVWQAARREGIRGFVWKSHEEHTVRRVADLPSGPPHVFSSVSLNPWATLQSVLRAIRAGATWVWGPTRAPSNMLAWELDLPRWWTDLARELTAADRALVLATGHLGPRGRAAMAELAADHPSLLSSVTHAQFIPDAELAALGATDCFFEIDLYTAAHDVPGRPRFELASTIARIRNARLPAYLVSDAGQAEVGDPYVFTCSMLAKLARHVEREVLEDVALTVPERIAHHVLGARSI